MSSKPPIFLVTGATGHQGGATARILLSRGGSTVRAFVRNNSSAAAQELEKLGAELYPGDFDNVEAIKNALVGVEGLFLNPHPHPKPDVQVQQAKHFVDAAFQSGVKDVVVSTVIFAGKRDVWEDFEGLRSFYEEKLKIEKLVKGIGFQSWTILRPGWLMHNYLSPQSAFHFPGLSTEGVINHDYEKGRKVPHFDPWDVGNFAAGALLEPKKFNGREIELGYQNLDIEEVAGVLGRISGTSVEAKKRGEKESAGLDRSVHSTWFQKFANTKDLSIDGKELEEKYGIKLTGFEEYLVKEKEALIKSLPLKK